jgi:hypothetical protein
MGRAHADKAVAAVAREAAAELYEMLMGDNTLYAAWKKQWPDADDRKLRRIFVSRFAARCLPIARATMALSLRGPTDTPLKRATYHALLRDTTLAFGRAGAIAGFDIPKPEK